MSPLFSNIWNQRKQPSSEDKTSTTIENQMSFKAWIYQKTVHIFKLLPLFFVFVSKTSTRVEDQTSFKAWIYQKTAHILKLLLLFFLCLCKHNFLIFKGSQNTKSFIVLLWFCSKATEKHFPHPYLKKHTSYRYLTKPAPIKDTSFDTDFARYRNIIIHYILMVLMVINLIKFKIPYGNRWLCMSVVDYLCMLGQFLWNDCSIRRDGLRLYHPASLYPK